MYTETDIEYLKKYLLQMSSLLFYLKKNKTLINSYIDKYATILNNTEIVDILKYQVLLKPLSNEHKFLLFVCDSGPAFRICNLHFIEESDHNIKLTTIHNIYLISNLNINDSHNLPITDISNYNRFIYPVKYTYNHHGLDRITNCSAYELISVHNLRCNMYSIKECVSENLINSKRWPIITEVIYSNEYKEYLEALNY
jgi:hypothetical protein